MNITNATELTDLFTHAVDMLSKLEINEEFITKDLFIGFEWQRISIGNRTKLGSMFFNYANNSGSTIIKPLGKTPQNQQKYKKL